MLKQMSLDKEFSALGSDLDLFVCQTCLQNAINVHMIVFKSFYVNRIVSTHMKLLSIIINNVFNIFYWINKDLLICKKN